jgi:trehalose/maltose transport system permease protein
MATNTAVRGDQSGATNGQWHGLTAPRASWVRARERLAWLFVLPAVLVVALVALYPLAQTIWLSFTDARFGSTRAIDFVGLRNYQRTLSDPQFLASFWRTMGFTAASVALTIILGMAVALVIHTRFRGRGLVRAAILIPWAIPSVVSSRLWQWMYHDIYGVFNDLLVVRLPALFGAIPIFGVGLASLFPSAKIAFIAYPATVMPALIAIDVWKATPFVALLLLAGLQLIPGDIYEAARVDGAGGWQRFWQMTLPLLRPALLVALIFRTLDAFRVFDIIFVTTGASPQTMTVGVFTQQRIVALQRLGEGSAVSVLIVLCVGVLAAAYIRLIRVEEL